MTLAKMMKTERGNVKNSKRGFLNYRWKCSWKTKGINSSEKQLLPRRSVKRTWKTASNRT